MKKCKICKKLLSRRQISVCSILCRGKLRGKQLKGRIGSKCINWKGGVVKCNNRIYIYDPTHPNAVLNKNYVPRARLVMSKKLRRPLLPNEHVHHKNGLMTDDRIENLVLLTSSTHKKVHPITESTRLKLRIISYKRKRKNGRFVSN